MQNTEIGTPFGGISAFDADSGDNGMQIFSIVATGETVPFTIDDSSGVLQVTGPLDRETVPQYLVSLSWCVPLNKRLLSYLFFCCG